MTRKLMIVLGLMLLLSIVMPMATASSETGSTAGVCLDFRDPINKQVCLSDDPAGTAELIEKIDRAGGTLICNRTGSCEEYTIPSLLHFATCTVDPTSCP